MQRRPALAFRSRTAANAAVKRRITFILAATDLAIGAAIVIVLVLSGADPATRGLDLAAAAGVAALLALTALPAFLLARARRAADLALACALGFPAAFLLGFAAILALLP
jgi:hypothetical protein